MVVKTFIKKIRDTGAPIDQKTSDELTNIQRLLPDTFPRYEDKIKEIQTGGYKYEDVKKVIGCYLHYCGRFKREPRIKDIS